MLTRGLAWPSSPAGPLAQCQSSLSSRQSDRRVADARAPPCRHATSLPALSPASATRWATSRVPSRSGRPPHFSPRLLPCSLSPRPNAAVAATRHCRSHHLPLASPTRPGAPPPRSKALRRATQAGASRGAVAVAFFASGRRGSPSPLRRLQSFPRAAEHARRTSVSSPPFPLRPRARIRA